MPYKRIVENVSS